MGGRLAWTLWVLQLEIPTGWWPRTLDPKDTRSPAAPEFGDRWDCWALGAGAGDLTWPPFPGAPWAPPHHLFLLPCGPHDCPDPSPRFLSLWGCHPCAQRWHQPLFLCCVSKAGHRGLSPVDNPPLPEHAHTCLLMTRPSPSCHGTPGPSTGAATQWVLSTSHPKSHSPTLTSWL